MQLWAIIVDSFRESLDRKIFWVIAALIVVVILGMVGLDFQANRVSLVFGLATFESQGWDPATEAGRAAILGMVIHLVMNLVVGWIGVLLMIVATANFFPTMMEQGAIDVVLSKPISRPRLFLYKYLASMVFVFLLGALFVVAMFGVMGLRWGIWAPGFLWSIPLLVLLFSYVYCVSVFVGVWTRSTVAAILLSLGAWVAYTGPGTIREVFEVTPDLRQQAPRTYDAVRIASWIPPKTDDIAYISSRLARGGSVSDFFRLDEERIETEVYFGPDMTAEEKQRQLEQLKRQARLTREYEQQRMRVNPFYSIGSSLLFEAVFVALALARFWRRDF